MALFLHIIILIGIIDKSSKITRIEKYLVSDNEGEKLKMYDLLQK